MIHDCVQFPYIVKLPQDRVLYELKDLRRRYLDNPQNQYQYHQYFLRRYDWIHRGIELIQIMPHDGHPYLG